jgi:hypothetical protein
MRFATSAPWCARATRGEPSGVMCWIDFIIVWSRMVLMSEFRFRILLTLGVHASDASDLIIVEYLLELLCDGSLVEATVMIR